MQVHALEYDRQQAAVMYKTYRDHLSAQTKIDAELERIYYQISRGRKVIAALASIAEAGLGPDGLPRLAICEAHATVAVGDCCGDHVDFFLGPQRRRSFRVPMPNAGYRRGVARLPHIPIHLRPKTALSNYHMLWEADWKAIPADPMLLRRIGKDAWVVVAAWDLTDLERSVLTARM